MIVPEVSPKKIFKFVQDDRQQAAWRMPNVVIFCIVRIADPPAVGFSLLPVATRPRAYRLTLETISITLGRLRDWAHLGES
ncbi:hypothetical protein VN97_g9811 [Penicillium thymicola]|uniref:Uncharacterized protein n=1 Tax=Penicillium thymicola TaxID=293382 RepID=A0AAI9X4Y3_PENTH|nr:hypothetical protein VN97_g9811 [Penicillium thymicola]